MPTIELTNDTIESLDFDFEQACEHSMHATHADEPAFYLIHAECPDCGRSTDYFICLDVVAKGRHRRQVQHYRTTLPAPQNLDDPQRGSLVTNKSKNIGTKFESQVVNYLKANGSRESKA